RHTRSKRDWSSDVCSSDLARDYVPSHVNRYLITLAGEFHRFYNSCRIKGEAPEVLAARLKLSDTVRAVIANCLALLGVSAPEKKIGRASCRERVGERVVGG